MNITLNWNGFLFAIVFVLFFMGTDGVRSLKRQQEQKAQSKKTHSIGVNS